MPNDLFLVLQVWFGGRAQIIEYLGRYTHTCTAPVAGKVTITAPRILQIDEEHISFKYNDYADARLPDRVTGQTGMTKSGRATNPPG